MKKYRGTILICIVLILIAGKALKAQDQYYRYWSFGINGGINNFIGDTKRFAYLPSTQDPSELKLAYGITVDKKFTPVFGLRGQVLYGELAGAAPEIDRIFETNLLEYNVSALFNLNNLFSANKKVRKVELYGLIGLGFSNWETDEYLYTNQDLQIGGNGNGDGFAGRTTETVLPFGLELDFHVNRNWLLRAGYTFRPVYSDFLDDNEGDFAYDMYNYTALGVSYKIHPATSYDRRYEPERRDPVSEEEMITRQPEETTGEESRTQPSVSKPAPEVSINTQTAQQIKNGETFGMTIDINKEHLSGSAEILQTFPSGFVPVEIAATNGKFSFEEQMLSISWDELPSAQNVQTSYNVKVTNVIPGKYLIPGMMIYKYNNKSQSVKFRNYITVERAMDEVDTKPEPKPEAASPAALEYRVQIRAKKTGTLSLQALAKKYNLNVPIKEDIHNGYYIYTVGSFDTYEEARNYRDTLRRRHNVNDAFVVAFRYGERLDKLPRK